MTHEARPVIWVVEPHIDGEPNVVDSQDGDEDHPDDLRDGLPDDLLYSDLRVLLPVEDHGGEVGGDQGVHSSTGTWIYCLEAREGIYCLQVKLPFECFMVTVDPFNIGLSRYPRDTNIYLSRAPT